ncbi:MAG TPA: LytTR family DNA-binding domain-containing protein [Chitinophagaceae bacterium]|nr:LytTR family DNA-binding domain-containing protein [Chitinophagaceae bacterium]
MKKIRCLLIDDEPLALQVLSAYVQKLDYLELAGVCHNAIDALSFLQKNRVDLLLLDIQMPGLTGIDFLRSLPHKPKVILTSAYAQYALEGYELNVVDYLLKPVSFERFVVAINKLFQLNTLVPGPAVPEHYPGLSNGFIYIKAEKKMRKVFLRDILYLESLKDFVRVQTTAKSIITYQTITYFEEKLPDDLFIRVHRSYIVSLHHVQSFTGTSIEINNFEIPIGRLYKINVLKALGAEM